MYRVFAKSALRLDEVNAKLDIGCDGIEIQLCDELLGSHGPHDWLDADEVFDLNSFVGKKIHSIHMPIIRNRGGDVTIERITDNEDSKLLDQVFYIANYFGEKEDRDIRIVMHSEISFETVMDQPSIWHDIIKHINDMLLKYPRTILCLENVTPFRHVKSGEILCLTNNFFDDNVKLCKLLRDSISVNENRIGVVLDICHQGITEKYMKLIYELSNIDMPDFSLETYLKIYAPYLKIIHFCDFKNYGHDKNHGTPFEDQEKVNQMLDLIRNYVDIENIVYLTLEVYENDYVKNDNYIKTKQMVDNYFKEN